MAMLEKKCIKCNASLHLKNNDIYQCENCASQYKLEFLHDKCKSKLDEISGCGAVNFFCKNCKLLVSKSDVKIQSNEIL